MTRPPNPELTAAMLESTTALIMEKGERAVTMGLVAERCGVSATIIHYYFKNRRGLLHATKRAMIDDLDAACRAAAAGEPSVQDRLRATAHAFLAWSLANRGRFLFVFAPLHVDEVDDADVLNAFGTTFEKFRNLIGSASDGEQRMTEEDAAMFVAALFGVAGMMANGHSGPAFRDPYALVDHAIFRAFGSVSPADPT